MSGWWRVKVRGEVERKKTEQKEEEKCEKKIEKVKVSVLHGCSKHKLTRFYIFILFGKQENEKEKLN